MGLKGFQLQLSMHISVLSAAAAAWKLDLSSSLYCNTYRFHRYAGKALQLLEREAVGHKLMVQQTINCWSGRHPAIVAIARHWDSQSLAFVQTSFNSLGRMKESFDVCLSGGVRSPPTSSATLLRGSNPEPPSESPFRCEEGT